MLDKAEKVGLSVTEEIEFIGFTWHLDDSYDLNKLDPQIRVQVRDSEHIAPKINVDTFASQMDQALFPPIVITQDDGMVDGNTRADAHRQRRERYVRAIVIETNLKSATAKARSQLAALAATLNQVGQQRLTHKEAVRAAENMIKLGFKSEEIVRRVGINSQVITQVKREIAANAKLAQVGLDAEAIGTASLRALGSEKVVGINDAPFRELALLAADARFNAKEINEAARSILELASDTKALDWLAEARKANIGRIGDVATTGKPGTVTAARALRQHLGYVLKFVGREDELIETSPTQRATHLAYAQKARAILDTLIAKLGPEAA